MHDNSFQGKFMKELENIKAQMKIIVNENKAVRDEIASIEKKHATTSTTKPNSKVNKDQNIGTMGKVNENNKRQKLRESDQESSSDELNDLTQRMNASDDKINGVLNSIERLSSLLQSTFDNSYDENIYEDNYRDDPEFEEDEFMGQDDTFINLN
jgi:prefoldin subunit 5